jgi:hypothetical protein
MRVPLDTTIRTGLGVVAPGTRLYVYTRGTTTQVTGYTTEAGAVAVTYPLTADVEGRFPSAWYPPGSYDLYSPDDAVNPTQAWEAAGGLGADGSVTFDMLSASVLAEIELGFNAYRPVRAWSGWYGNNVAGAPTTYVICNSSPFAASAGNGSSLGMFNFDPARHAAPPRDTVLRLIVDIFVDNVSPGASRTALPGLYPVTNSNNALVAATVGTLVPGSQDPDGAQTLAAGGSYTLDSGDFEAPAASRYAPALIAAGGTVAAGCFITVSAALLVRNV